MLQRVVLPVLLLCVLSAAAQPPRAENKPPNIVLIVVDTLRADRIEASRNGVAVMPNLRELGASGWYFRKCVAAATWTKPSVTSIFTSLYPSTHGLVHGTRLTLDAETPEEHVEGLPGEKETMAAYLKRQGYATMAIQTNHLLGTRDGFAQGFDTYIELLGASSQEVNNTLFQNGKLLKEPFFLYLHYMEPHSPYNPPSEHRDAFGALPQFTEADLAAMSAAGSFSNYYMDKLGFDTGINKAKKFADLSDAGRDFYRTMYDGDCRYVDAQVKRAHDEILKHWTNTVFVVTSDHGEELWEHGAVGHGRSLEQELVRVPLLIFGAGISPRDIADTWVEGIDILPTVAGILGTPSVQSWQGRSLAAEPLAQRPVFSETLGMVVEAGASFSCVIKDDLKLTRNGDGREQVVQISTGQQAAASELLRDLLDTHIAEMRAHPLAKIAPTQRGLDEEMLERLRALGYTAGGAKP